MKTQRHGFFLLLVLLALMLNLAHPAVLPTAAQSSPEAHTLIAKARANGTVPVIVGLRVAFQPEGRLADAASVQNQRAAIRVAQDALLTQMAAYHPQSVKKFDYIPFMAMWVDAAALTFLSTWRDVTSIEEDVAVPPTLAESVPLIGAPTVWASGYTGSGQTVAILDSGVDKTHPFLAGKVVSEACYSNGGGGGTSVCPGGSNSTATGSGVNCSTSISGCTHGTHVAGIAAGKANGSLGFNGVAKDADIIAIQVFSGFNNASDCSPNAAPCALTYTSDQVLGLQRVQALSSSHNIAAANMSLGGGRYYTQASCDSANASRKAAIDNLRSLNIATVIASGNSGYTDSMSSPGCISTAVSVGSTGDGSSGTTQDAVMSYSNSVSFLNLLAPGSKSYSSTPGNTWGNWDGTSMAAPHVAGAWALLKSKLPSATVNQVLSALTTTGLSVTDSRNGVTKPRIRVNLAANALVPPSGSSIFLPIALNNYGTLPGPTPGMWSDSTGSVMFYVTPDSTTLRRFAIVVDLPDCGTYWIYRTIPAGDAAILSNQFSFSGPFYVSGTFGSSTTASGTTGLSSFGPVCDEYWDGGPWSWSTTWQNSTQPTMPVRSVGSDTVEFVPATGAGYKAIPVK
jgi:subtilisin family serine protease